MKKRKIIIIIVAACIGFFFFVLDFIPVKFAVRLEDIMYDENTYVCKGTATTDGNWVATPELNPHLDEYIYLNDNSALPFDYLKEISDRKKGGPVINRYVFYEKIEKKNYGTLDLNFITPNNWDVVYPIRSRMGLRAFYVPDSYLTVYDFDWMDIIANVFNTKTDDDVPDEETALKLGSELLAEKYNYDLSDPNYILGAKEKDGIWKGSIAPKMREDYIILDGGAYVKFRKSDGKVIEFHLDG